MSTWFLQCLCCGTRWADGEVVPTAPPFDAGCCRTPRIHVLNYDRPVGHVWEEDDAEIRCSRCGVRVAKANVSKRNVHARTCYANKIPVERLTTGADPATK